MGDYPMGDAPPAGPQYQQRQNKNNNRNHKTCNNCGKPGHLAKDCRSKPNVNMNGNGNVNNGNTGNNANNINVKTAKGTNNKVDPETTKPHDRCYMHAQGTHSNAECKNPSNKWSSTNNPANQNGQNGQNNQNNGQQQQPHQQKGQNKQQNQQQNQQQSSQQHFEHFEQEQRIFVQKRNANLRSHRLPIPGADCNYCERCNSVGHLAAVCTAPPIDKTRFIVCFQCFNPGHTATECRHPAFCGNCKSVNCRSLYTSGSCQGNKHIASYFTTFDEVRPTKEPGTKALSAPLPRAAAAAAAAAAGGPKAAPQPQKAKTNPLPRIFQANGGHPIFGKPPTYFHKGEWHPIPNDTHPLRKVVADLAADQVAATKLAVTTKCQRAHTSYPLHLLNDTITLTERDLAPVNPAHPRMALPESLHPTTRFEHLVKNWIHTGAFAGAAALIRAGVNFFRDPRALDGIHKALKPVCLTCEGPGMVLDATFCEIVPGEANVLEVEDYAQWGVSVAFACGCCKDRGFAWVGPSEA